MQPVQPATHIPGHHSPQADRPLRPKKDPCINQKSELYTDFSLLLELADESEPFPEKPRKVGGTKRTGA
jgi:hypothetical protein